MTNFITELEPRFITTKTLPDGYKKHNKAVYLDEINQWAVLDISTRANKDRYTIIDLSDLELVADSKWRFARYQNRNQGSINFYVQSSMKNTSTGKMSSTTINRVILFGWHSDSKLVADHTQSNKLDNRRTALQGVAHAENLIRAESRDWEGENITKRVAVITPDGEFESISHCAKFYGITRQCAWSRISRQSHGFKRA